KDQSIGGFEMMTSEQLKAWLDELEGIRPPKPKAVVVEDQVVRDANSHVSRADPNYAASDDGVVRGGSIQDLKRVLNVQPSDFVLVAGWLLQALNPVGDYPFINVHGESEVGKTFMCNVILRTVDPRTTELRKPRKVEDLLIAARNNWTIGFDNFSWMSGEFSDTLCMIAMGISSGSRTLYTDDEEHTFTVRRPVIFNGIPGDLTERSDLASRTIKLEIPRITKRRTKTSLEQE